MNCASTRIISDPGFRAGKPNPPSLRLVDPISEDVAKTSEKIVNLGGSTRASSDHSRQDRKGAPLTRENQHTRFSGRVIPHFPQGTLNWTRMPLELRHIQSPAVEGGFTTVRLTSGRSALEPRGLSGLVRRSIRQGLGEVAFSPKEPNARSRDGDTVIAQKPLPQKPMEFALPSGVLTSIGGAVSGRVMSIGRGSCLFCNNGDDTGPRANGRGAASPPPYLFESAAR